MDGGPRKGCIDYIITPVTGCFFFFNFIFFVTGITILAVCAVAYSLPETADAYNGLDEPGSNNDFSISGFREKAVISLMVGGGIVMLVGFLGCFGVSIGNSVLIYMYGMLLAIMVMLQLASLVFIYENKDEMIKSLQGKLTKMVKEYQAYNNTDDAAMNLIQQFSKCCGVRSGRDYTKSAWFNRTRLPNQRVPLSCCQLRYGPNGTTIPVNPRCQFGLISRNNPFTDQGCNAAIKRNIFSSGVTAVGLMMGVTLVQLLAICGAAIIERHYLDQDLAHKASRRDITSVVKNDVEDQIKKEHKASYTPIYSVM
ncbi:tetraspanin-18B-like [Littorina saxatilis]|uniref:tetraspanin-18B-like n=1 Tax=Littorina saxatilis TaxID=31220 RepID=UPI0038B52F79